MDTDDEQHQPPGGHDDNQGDAPADSRPARGATDEDRLVIEALTEHRMADWHAERGDVDSAERAYRTAVEQFTAAHDPLGAARATHALGILQHQQGRDEDADRTLGQAADAFAAARSLQGAATSTRARARLADARGDEATPQLYIRALDLFAEAQDVERVDAGQQMTECLVALGLFHHRSGQEDEAMHALDSVLREAVNRQSSSTFFSSGAGPEPLTVPHLEEVVSVHSALLQQRGLLDDARAMLRDALRLGGVRDVPRLRGLVHHELGLLALRTDDPDQAVGDFDRARETLLEVADDESVRPSLAEAEFNLAVLRGQSGDATSAVELARSAEQRFTALGSTGQAAEGAFLAGTALLHLERADEAAAEYRRAADLHEEAGNPEAAQRSRTAADALDTQEGHES